jgi:uncharacterized protein (UPF0276 family)|tara:strand:- start:1485 stop:2330 length:846 start_codon:yes stop_codon:yes gene_type:complete
MSLKPVITGAGLGLRRSFINDLSASFPDSINFMEVAPENWIDVGGRFAVALEKATSQAPLVCHGLSLNLGGLAPIDEAFVHRVKHFLETFHVAHYSEHLSYCGDEGHLYDLMPIPFTTEAVRHVVDRIKRVQDILGRSIAVENVSYYAAPGKSMDEIEFLNTVLEQADCQLLLDINNVYVNSVNHCYDPVEFLKALPGHRIAYGHIAGHFNEAEDLLVDTHGADVIDPVWSLLATAYNQFGVFPTLLERDFNIPSIADLIHEVDQIHSIQENFTTNQELRV